MQIIDNFLDQKSLELIQHTLLKDTYFPWYYVDYKVRPKDPNPYDFQFVHNFYINHTASSQIEILYPILEKINPSAIVRIKANLNPRTENIIEYGFHHDYDFFDGETAIFYVNTNNGYTVFKDGTKIESLENRLIKFDARLDHAGTSCSDQKVRSVINFNYYKWMPDYYKNR